MVRALRTSLMSSALVAAFVLACCRDWMAAAAVTAELVLLPAAGWMWGQLLWAQSTRRGFAEMSAIIDAIRFDGLDQGDRWPR